MDIKELTTAVRHLPNFKSTGLQVQEWNPTMGRLEWYTMAQLGSQLNAVSDPFSQYVLLAGRAGGQQIRGGTAAADTLKFIATSGVGVGAEYFAWFTGTNGGTEIMRLTPVDLQLMISMPVYISGTNRFRYKNTTVRAKSNAAQTINTATQTGVIFNAEDFDTDTLHEGVTQPTRLIAAIAGKYLITGGLYWDHQTLGTVTFLRCALKLNGTTVIPGSDTMVPPISSFASNGQAQSVSGIYSLAANDYVELIAQHDKTAAGTLTISTDEAAALSMAYLGE